MECGGICDTRGGFWMIHQTLEKAGGIAVPRTKDGRKGLSTPGTLAAACRGPERVGEIFGATPGTPKRGRGGVSAILLSEFLFNFF